VRLFLIVGCGTLVNVTLWVECVCVVWLRRSVSGCGFGGELVGVLGSGSVYVRMYMCMTGE